MSNPKVSVIVPVYNVEPYLKRCLNSIVNQTYQNLEIILVNDGSTDNSGSICDEYAQKDDRIIVIHKENGGVSKTRNIGLERATGEYIAFVDSDDYIHHQTYEFCFQVIEKEEVDFVEFDVKKVSYTESFNNIVSIDYELHNSKEVIDFKVKDKKHYVYLCNKVFKRNFIVKYKFPNIAIGEDAFMFNEYSFNITTVSYIPLQLYHYYQREGSATKEIFTKKHLDSLRARIELYLLLKEIYEDIAKEQLNQVIKYFFTDFGIYTQQKQDKVGEYRLELINMIIPIYYDIIKSNLISRTQINDLILACENPLKLIKKHDKGIVRRS